MDKVFIKPCARCGEPIEYTYATKQMRYCPECKAIRQKEVQQQKSDEWKARQFAMRRAEQIAHQQDPTVWTRDYAERQKQKTLAMIGGIKV